MMEELEKRHVRYARIGLREVDRRAWIVLLAAMVAMTALILHLTKGTTFFYDEWAFVQDRRPWTADAILQRHNEHLWLVAVLVYKMLFELFGLSDFLPYQLVGIAFHLVCVALLFEVAKRRVGNLIALAVALSLLTLGTAWQDLVWPFQMGFFGSVAAGLAMILMFEKRSRKADIGACGLLIIAIASSSFGFIVAIMAAVSIGWRSDRWRRIWILAVPLVLYECWNLKYGTSAIKTENIAPAPTHMVDQASAALGGIAGLAIEYGRPLLILAIVVTLIVLARANRVGPRVVAPMLALVGYLALTAFARADLNDPTASRYIYLGAVLIFLVAIELWVLAFARGGISRMTENWSRVTRKQATTIATVGLLCLFAFWGNLDQLRRGAAGQSESAAAVAAELGAMESVDADIPREFRPDEQRGPQVIAGPYLDAVKEFGSPAATESEVLEGKRVIQQAADDELKKIYGTPLVPVLASQVTNTRGERGSGRLIVTGSSGGRLLRKGSCIAFAAQNGQEGALELDLESDKVMIRAQSADVAVYIRRYVPDYNGLKQLGVVKADRAAALNLPRGRWKEPWHVRLATAKSETVCPTR